MSKATFQPKLMRGVFLTILVAVCLVVSGCALNRMGAQEVSAALERYVQANSSTAETYAQTAAPHPPAMENTSGTQSQVYIPETLRDLIVLALRENPEVLAAAELAHAKAARIPQVTALPDPILNTKTLPEPVRTAEGDNYFILGISQKFPVSGELDLAGRIVLEETRMALDRLQETRLRVIADVKRAYFRLYILDKSLEVTKENQELLRGLIDVARAQVAAGRRSQDDVLRAQVELSNLEAELISLRQRRATARATLNEVLNRPTTTEIPTPADFDTRKAEPAIDELFDRANGVNPTLARLRRQIERDHQAIELAKLAYWPDFTIGFEWMLMEPRDAFQPPINPATGRRPTVSKMSEDGSDNWAVTFGFNLPIWYDKIKAGIREAKHNLAASNQQYTAARNRVHRKIEDAYERVRAQQELAALFKSTIIPQAEQAYHVSQASYTAGTSDFLYVIDNWRKWIVFNIQYYRSLGELERSVADLEQAIGLSLAEMGASK